MAMLVSYRMRNDAVDVGVFLEDNYTKLFSSFEAAIRKAYPEFNVLLQRDLPVYNEHEISDKCNILVGRYSNVKDTLGNPIGPLFVPEMIVPAYVTSSAMIDEEYMKKFLAAKATKPDKVMFSPNIPVDPPMEEILSKEFVEELYKGSL